MKHKKELTVLIRNAAKLSKTFPKRKVLMALALLSILILSLAVTESEKAVAFLLAFAVYSIYAGIAYLIIRYFKNKFNKTTRT